MIPNSSWLHIDRLLTRLRLHRQPLTLVFDGLMVALAWQLTYLFRLGFERWFSARPAYDGWVMLAVVAVYLLAFQALRIPRQMWRFSGFDDIKRMVGACLLAGAVCALAVLMAHLREVPRAVLALHPFMTVVLLALTRVFYRMLYEHARQRITGSALEVKRALVLGAGEAARRLLSAIQTEGWVVLGLLDDDPAKQGARIGGVPVLGRVEALPQLAVLPEVTHLVVAMPGARSEARRRILDVASQTGLPVLTVPSLEELQSGDGTVSRVRAIEPEDLLGREPVALDEAGVAALINGQTVMITGAGGSIGSELCRQVAKYGPAKLVLYELSEFALYQIEQQLSQAYPHLKLERLIGDVRQFEHVRATMQAQRPQVVFHAAAFKHVPLMESDNAWAALQNNTLGTYHAALAAAQSGVERFVLISTDKAVNPTNVMGASKRAAEMMLSYLATQGHATRFMAVRFGNVLGSSGSVIPKFKAQIERGGPVTVTHPDITRYFMTIPEASRLVLQAAALANSGQVYVLDMGEPVKITELARKLIALSGHREGHGPGCIPITFSGLRPGEKLYEELLADADETLPSQHPMLRIARLQDQALNSWAQQALAWLQGGQVPPPHEVRAHLAELVNTYRPGGDAGL